MFRESIDATAASIDQEGVGNPEGSPPFVTTASMYA